MHLNKIGKLEVEYIDCESKASSFCMLEGTGPSKRLPEATL